MFVLLRAAGLPNAAYLLDLAELAPEVIAVIKADFAAALARGDGYNDAPWRRTSDVPSVKIAVGAGLVPELVDDSTDHVAGRRRPRPLVAPLKPSFVEAAPLGDRVRFEVRGCRRVEGTLGKPGPIGGS